MRGSELLAQLESCTLPEDGFHHADHVRAAWEYLRRNPPLEAMRKFSEAVRAYAAFRGKPERYHETVTWAYLLLIRERMERAAAHGGWDEFAAANRDLFAPKNGLLLKYYRPETLKSDLARRVFLMPDRGRRRSLLGALKKGAGRLSRGDLSVGRKSNR